MARPLSIERVRKRFLASLETAFRIYGPAREWAVWNYESITEAPYAPRVAAKVLGLAFLGAVTAWEEFVEETFIRYMAGATSENGYSPKLRVGSCKSTTHALQVLSGAAKITNAGRFLKWSDFGWVIEVSETFFEKGHPYSNINPQFRERLTDAQIIRNRVAHNSDHAKRAFKKVANKLAKLKPEDPLPQGYSPGFLLRESVEHGFPKKWLDSINWVHWGDTFEAFIAMFVELANGIAPTRHHEFSVS